MMDERDDEGDVLQEAPLCFWWGLYDADSPECVVGCPLADKCQQIKLKPDIDEETYDVPF